MDISARIPGISTGTTKGIPDHTSFPNWRAPGIAPFSKALRYNTEFEKVTLTQSTFAGSLGAGTKWAAITAHENGKLYCGAYDANNFMQIDPSNDTVAFFGGLAAGSGKFVTMLNHPNGNVYAIPSDATYFCEIEPNNGNKVTQFGSVAGTNKYRGAVVLPNGMILCIPFGVTAFALIDPYYKTITHHCNIPTFSYYGACVVRDKVYLCPYDAGDVLELDYRSLTYTIRENTFLASLGTNKFTGFVHGPDGNLYAIPYDSQYIMGFNPNTKQFSFVFESVSTDKWTGGTVGPDGCIYATPYLGVNTIMRFDWRTQTFSNFGSVAGSNKFVGMALSKFGTLYAPAFSATVNLKGLTARKELLNENFYLSTRINKL